MQNSSSAARAAIRPFFAVSMVVAIGCATASSDPTASPGDGAPQGARNYELGAEMAQLEKDLASAEYAESILAIRNHNELDGEIGRADLPDNAARFAALHGGVAAVAEDALLAAAYDRRRRIDEAFLALMRRAYAGIDREARFEDELARVRSEAAAAASRSVATVPAARVESVLLCPGAERQWPRWRGPWGDGTSRESGLPARWSETRGIAWKTAIPGGGNSSPVIWDDRIFLTTAFDEGRRRSLVCVRRSDGELLYVRDAPFVEPEGRVIAKNGYASATPVVDGERVIAFFGNTGLVAFDFDGEVLWHRPLGPFDAMHGTGASPVLCGDLAILMQEQSGKDSIGIAVDKRTGETRWESTRAPALGWSTPLVVRVDGRLELIYGAKHTVAGLDPLTGAELWRVSGPTNEVVPTPIAGHGFVYSCSGRNGPTLAIRPGGRGDVSASHIGWRVVRGGPHVPSPVLSADLLWFANDSGIVTCLDAQSGETIYQHRLNGRFSASPLAGDGKVYFTSERGETHVVRAGREFEIIAVNSIEETTLASLASLDGRLYLRSESTLWAIAGDEGRP